MKILFLITALSLSLFQAHAATNSQPQELTQKSAECQELEAQFKAMSQKKIDAALRFRIGTKPLANHRVGMDLNQINGYVDVALEKIATQMSEECQLPAMTGKDLTIYAQDQNELDADIPIMGNAD